MVWIFPSKIHGISQYASYIFQNKPAKKSNNNNMKHTNITNW